MQQRRYPVLIARLRVLMCAAFAAAVAQAHSPVVVVPQASPEVVVETAAQPEPLAAAPAAPESLRPTEADLRRYAAIIRGASRAHGVEGDLVQAVIWAESSYNPRAVSAAGAAGLMQLMPQTAERYGVRDVFDPEENIRAGVKILGELLVQFDGDVELTLAAYNAGPNAVIRAGNRIPSQPETAAYVPRVLAYYHRLQARRA
jgi:soluble lytic murein transglycosylase-like protein